MKIGTYISTHTLRGERDTLFHIFLPLLIISTHTLRGERDKDYEAFEELQMQFQLTRSVGSVTRNEEQQRPVDIHFNSHAPWGA